MYNVPYIKHLIKHLPRRYVILWSCIHKRIIPYICVDLHACIKYLRNDYSEYPSHSFWATVCPGVWRVTSQAKRTCIAMDLWCGPAASNASPTPHMPITRRPVPGPLITWWQDFLSCGVEHPLLGSQVKCLWLLLLKIGNASLAIVNRHWQLVIDKRSSRIHDQQAMIYRLSSRGNAGMKI
jgi:hypothetical protein